MYSFLFFRWPMRSNEPANNQHFFRFLIVYIATKPNYRGEERFRETLVELSIETNSNYSGMRHKLSL